MNFDRKYLGFAMGYAVIGICFGIFMAASHNYALKEAHSHILLIGFMLSLGYGMIHKLWLEVRSVKVAMTQFILHQAGAGFECIGLFLLYGEFLTADVVEPILGISALAVLVAAVLMLYMVVREGAGSTEPAAPA